MCYWLLSFYRNWACDWRTSNDSYSSCTCLMTTMLIKLIDMFGLKQIGLAFWKFTYDACLRFRLRSQFYFVWCAHFVFLPIIFFDLFFGKIPGSKLWTKFMWLAYWIIGKKKFELLIERNKYPQFSRSAIGGLCHWVFHLAMATNSSFVFVSEFFPSLAHCGLIYYGLHNYAKSDNW